MFPEFKAWPKIPRTNKQVFVATEKIDGTNGIIAIDKDNNVYAGSRNRWITPEDDNYGFAQWVQDNKEDLLKLGEGYHYGEWYGLGIQRGYNLNEKRYALFNQGRWHNNPDKPECCQVVPFLASYHEIETVVEEAMRQLQINGSSLVPGFMKPEGIVVYNTITKAMLKVTFENSGGKWNNE